MSGDIEKLKKEPAAPVLLDCIRYIIDLHKNALGAKETFDTSKQILQKISTNLGMDIPEKQSVNDTYRVKLLQISVKGYLDNIETAHETFTRLLPNKHGYTSANDVLSDLAASEGLEIKKKYDKAVEDFQHIVELVKGHDGKRIVE